MKETASLPIKENNNYRIDFYKNSDLINNIKGTVIKSYYFETRNEALNYLKKNNFGR